MARKRKEEPAEVGIERGRVYPKAELCRRMGWKEWAWLEALAQGMPVLRQGRRAYVDSDRLIEWMSSKNQQKAVTA